MLTSINTLLNICLTRFGPDPIFFNAFFQCLKNVVTNAVYICSKSTMGTAEQFEKSVQG